MLYLEDYLEMIEHLPQELKDRFTEIRELDLEVQNDADKLDEKVKSFFQLARKQKTPERDAEFEAIRKDYYKVLDNADEKVNQANQLYELVDRYLRKLDQELHKFKMELEADNAGITEILEKRSIEMDMQDRERERSDFHSQKENRYVAGQVVIKSEKKAERKNSHERAGTSTVPSAHSSGMTTPTLAYSLGHMGAGGNAIAAAASQAIAATQQMQQGRRTASLKASYDAVHLGLQSAEFSVGNREILVNTDLHQAAQQALAATTSDRSGSEQKRNKRKSQHTHNPDFVQPPAEELSEEPVLMDTTEPTEWSTFADPAEPRYCLCNEISYGDMVACDNQECLVEWFHFSCVGITQTPKGKWYCPQCAASMKRRGRR